VGNETRWYTNREAVKRALPIVGSSLDSAVDAAIESASNKIEKGTNRRFIPLTKTAQYDWPTRSLSSWELLLPEDLIAVTTLTKEGDDVTAIASTDYFLSPQYVGPPYHKIEIDLASTAFFSIKDTHQRQIRVIGRFGYSEDTRAAGTVDGSGLASGTTATSFKCSNEALIGVGDTLLIESEAAFVSAKSAAANGSDLLDGALVVNKAEVGVTVDDGSLYNVGEVILVDSERMLIQSIAGNVLTVERGHDGTTLALHANNTAVNVFRTLTIVRGVNGTTAATHADTTAVSIYTPPGDIASLCLAMAVNEHVNNRSGWTGVIGSGEASVESKGAGLSAFMERVFRNYKRRSIGRV
jgi:hypothetical protein